MKIGIIGAMEKEVVNLKNQLKDLQEIKRQHITFYVGKLFHHEIILTFGGMGKVATGIVCATMINNFTGIEAIVNVGVSGGIRGKVEPGDVVVSSRCGYADVDIRGIDDVAYGQFFGLPRMFPSDEKMLKVITDACIKGDILTGDKFFISEKDVTNLINNYFPDANVVAMDMESTAFAHSCYLYNIPFIAIRAISDVIGNEAQGEEYYGYIKKACKKSNDILFEILERM